MVFGIEWWRKKQKQKASARVKAEAEAKIAGYHEEKFFAAVVEQLPWEPSDKNIPALRDKPEYSEEQRALLARLMKERRIKLIPYSASLQSAGYYANDERLAGAIRERSDYKQQWEAKQEKWSRERPGMIERLASEFGWQKDDAGNYVLEVAKLHCPMTGPVGQEWKPLYLEDEMSFFRLAERRDIIEVASFSRFSEGYRAKDAELIELLREREHGHGHFHQSRAKPTGPETGRER